MRLHRLILAAATAACLLLTAAAQAQGAAPVEVRPGSALLDGTRIPLRTDTFQVSMEGAGQLRLVLRTAALGDTALLRVERMTLGDTEASVDSFAVRKTTLAPLYGASRDVMESSLLRYPPGRVEGTYAPADGEKRTISERLSAPVFYSNSIDLALASLPLEPGRSFEIATWTPEGLDGVISARVTGAETVPTVDGGRCTGWRVETEDENGLASVFWIEESTRSLLAFSAGWMEIRVLRHAACR